MYIVADACIHKYSRALLLLKIYVIFVPESSLLVVSANLMFSMPKIKIFICHI